MTSVTARIVGRERLSAALREKAKQYQRAANAGLEAWAAICRNAAVLSVQKGSKTGRVYTYANGRVHQASARGEAPATFTGNLAGSIGWNVDEASLVAEVFATAIYATWLELVADRPFMLPALNSTKEQGLRIFTATLSRAS